MAVTSIVKVPTIPFTDILQMADALPSQEIV